MNQESLGSSTTGAGGANDAKPESLLCLCRDHNNEILTILNDQIQQKTDVTELVRTTQRIQKILEKCLSDYGSQPCDLKVVENIYTQIWEYEKKILQLQKKGALARIITQARLRPKIDQLSNNICMQVENMEREMRENMVNQIVGDNKDEFEELLKLVDPEFAKKAPQRFNSSTGALRRSTAGDFGIKDSATRSKLDDQLSIVKDSAKREEMLQTIPMLKVKPISKVEIASVSSGVEEEEKTVEDHIFAKRVSTYPRSASGVREGDPICDQFALTHFENGTIAVVADGCGWGVEAKEAARKASQMFVHYMKRHTEDIDTTRSAASVILKGLHTCHKAIIEGRTEENLFNAGTTTMIGGICFELPKPENGNHFAFVCASIGDCKGYIWMPRTERIEEFTKGNRGNHDMRDPGGRIGPTLEGGAPDLRNLKLYSVLCNEGDIIMLVSDGVHDNLDPKIMGKTPAELKLSAESWDNLSEEDENIIQSWIEDFMLFVIKEHKPVTVTSVALPFVQHALKQTSAMRTFMEENAGQKVPKDYQLLPGKLDHTTALSFKVGNKKKSWTPSSLPLETSRTYRPVVSQASQSPATSPKKVMAPLQRVDSMDSSSLEELYSSVWDDRFGDVFVKANESKKFLEQQLVGTFLIRFSGSRPGSFVLDYVREPNHVRSVRLSAHPGGGFAAPSAGGGSKELVFKTLHDLVSTYSKMNVLTLPFSTNLTQKPWFFGDVTGEDAEQLLAGLPQGTFLIRFSNQGFLAASFVAASGKVAKGLITNSAQGFQVNNQGMYFANLDDLIKHYQDQHIFSNPFQGV